MVSYGWLAQVFEMEAADITTTRWDVQKPKAVNHMFSPMISKSTRNHMQDTLMSEVLAYLFSSSYWVVLHLIMFLYVQNRKDLEYTYLTVGSELWASDQYLEWGISPDCCT